jgi:hypothetical protein
VDAGPHHGNAAHHRLVGDVDQPSRLQWDALADKKHPTRIAVPAVEDHGHVDVEDIALHQPPVAGDAMAHDVVDRGANRFRKAAIVERRRDCVVIDNESVAQPVELAGGKSGPDMGSDEVERLGSERSSSPHAVEGFRTVDLDRAVARLEGREPHHHILLHATVVRIVS